MNKWLKRTLIASAAVTAAGAVLLGAGMALGGSPSFYYDADGLHVKENTEGAVRADYVLEKTQIAAPSGWSWICRMRIFRLFPERNGLWSMFWTAGIRSRSILLKTAR